LSFPGDRIRNACCIFLHKVSGGVSYNDGFVVSPVLALGDFC